MYNYLSKGNTMSQTGALQLVYCIYTKIHLKGLKGSWNIGYGEYGPQNTNDSNELRWKSERGVICKERECIKKTEGFFMTVIVLWGCLYLVENKYQLVLSIREAVIGFISICKSKEALSSSPETWGVDKQLWLLFAQVLSQGEGNVNQ